ncbi:MAG: hypothetical protein QOG54_1356 [Actinomycetota bacterium]|nr:hypothetical protein [Actinomycetota bacterium]
MGAEGDMIRGQTKEKPPVTRGFVGAGDQIRTGDPHLGKAIAPDWYRPRKTVSAGQRDNASTLVAHALDAFASLVGTEWGRDFSRFVRQEQTLRGSLNTGFTHNGARLGATL